MPQKIRRKKRRLTLSMRLLKSTRRTRRNSLAEKVRVSLALLMSRTLVNLAKMLIFTSLPCMMLLSKEEESKEFKRPKNVESSLTMTNLSERKI